MLLLAYLRMPARLPRLCFRSLFAIQGQMALAITSIHIGLFAGLAKIIFLKSNITLNNRKSEKTAHVDYVDPFEPSQ